MIRSIIIEDSRLVRKELIEMLKIFPQVHIISETGNPEDAIKIIQKEKPDLLFLDIHLPGKNGFELLEELDAVPAVIFTTAFDQYAIRSFEFNTIDYLLKPISNDRLSLAIERVEARLQSTKNIFTEINQVFIKDGDHCWFVKIKDIFLLESKGNYTQVYFENNKSLVLKSLNHFESVLDNAVFFRTNRQQIVNLKYIENVISWFNGKLKLKLKSGIEIEVSRRQTDKIKEMFSF
ncbi:MAG: DNA-binding response regulator [Bacteroidetes bacterium RIFOXYA12_FULL_35_11]|nr:MAG: DNA-binding response regulator [Bacteroidetes bacterium GWF2_35_48]OFY73361.1 MAG: DNA-binding response regulator [Bacteroidetes bacterium RIFOXYA12_FULL_35_11]OFZ06260.1 MAG: DNA-binding response regulator [Bacteroidetes bacterium RIFOXYC12_FULL_35_7]